MTMYFFMNNFKVRVIKDLEGKKKRRISIKIKDFLTEQSLLNIKRESGAEKINW